MEIKPEKEIILIMSEDQNTESIVLAIHSYLEMDKPGNGILFIQDIEKVYGLYPHGS